MNLTKKSMITILAIVLIVIGVGLLLAPQIKNSLEVKPDGVPPQPSRYYEFAYLGTEWKLPIKFPDFSIKYIGSEDQSTGPVPMGDVFKFEIMDNKGNSQEIFWSTGTGDIGPQSFTVDSKKFFLFSGTVFWSEGDLSGYISDKKLVEAVVNEQKIDIEIALEKEKSSMNKSTHFPIIIIPSEN